MRTFSNNFFDSLSGIRELNILVKYKDKNGTMLLTSEADEKLLTENGDFIGTETGDTTYNEETIKNAFPKFNVNLFSTVCKMATIESKIELEKGNRFNLKIGVKVGENYEYMNYGDYLIIEEPTYNADTETYTIVGYDRMIESSVLYDDDPLELTYPITHKNMLKAICDKFNWAMPKISYTNQNKTIESDIYIGQKLTYRDILDDLLKGTGDILWFDINNNLCIKYPDFETTHEIDESFLKDTNVQIKEKYGPVNSIEVITTDGAILDAIKDNQSIEENGEYKLQLNSLLLQNYSSEYLTNLFNKVKGLEYYIYDFDTIGQLIYEPLDAIDITIGENTYSSLVLNDEIKVSDGLEETIYTDKPNTAENDFIVITDEDKKLNDAFIKLDKANAEIVLKVNSDGKIAQIELNGNADEGSTINIDADQLNLTASDIINLIADNSINLTSKNITITSDNFSVTPEGNLSATSGNFSGNISSSNISSSEITGSTFYLTYNDYVILGLYTANNGGWIHIGNQTGTALTDITPEYIWVGEGNDLTEIRKNRILVTNGTSTTTITPTTVTPGSLEESKKDFENYENALQEIMNTDIYKYHYKSENSKNKKHVGFVIGKNRKYSKDITTVIDGEEIGADLYSMVSVLWQGVKEQQKQIEELKEEIKSLKGDGK